MLLLQLQRCLFLVPPPIPTKMVIVSPPSHFQFITSTSPKNSYEIRHLLLSSCKSARQLKQIHALIIKANPTITNTVNPVYVFNTIIQSLSTSNTTTTSSFPQVFNLYRQMLLLGLSPDTYTLPYLLKACSQSHALSEALQIHAHSIKTGLYSSNLFVKNTLMRHYALCGFIHAVENVFHHGPHKDLISWTTLIQAYAKMGYPSEAISTFFRMDCKVDQKTLVVVLSACSQLGDFTLGKKILEYMDYHLFNVHSDVFLGNALLDMYLKCGQPDLARQLFHQMPVKNLVSWNSMISGLAHQGLFKESLDMFRRMQNMGGLKPDAVTVVAVLNSCANLGVLHLGKWVHSYIDKNHMKADGYVGNALVDMYSKCGSIDQAFKVFQAMKYRDVYSYTAMIVGFAMHGKADRALGIFSEMPRMGIQPDHVTFVGVLSACSHAGLVDEGRRYFEDMSRLHHLQPQTEHYGCMVDLFGRAGLINEAQEFINKMPFLPDASVWGSLLGACKIHAKVELGETVIQKLVEMEPERDGAYILMSNIYSSANRWRDALKWRKVLKQKLMKKTPGCSSIEIDGTIHEFRKGEKSHPKSRELNKLLQEMTHHLRNYGLSHSIAVC